MAREPNRRCGARRASSLSRMKVLVTGGAGFIGSNFVHRTLRTRPDAEVTVLDALTYAGSTSSLEGVLDRIRFVEGDVADAAAVDPLVAERDASSTSPPSRTTTTRSTTPRPFVRTNLVGTFTLLEAVRTPRRAAPPRLHRRGLRRPRARRPDAVHRGHAVHPSPPVLRDQGRLRPPRARVGPLVRACGRLCRTARTTTGRASTSRSSSPGRSPTSSTGSGPSCTATGATSATGSTSTTTTTRCVADPRPTAGSGDTYLIGADGESNNREVVRMILELLGRDPDDYDHVIDRAGHDRGTPSTRTGCARSWAGRRATATSATASPRRSTGTARTRRGGVR